ncbi:MAG: hypothetical protein HON90_13160 [Halobacteriovoraceae bacterium]|jgi:hypothetical protein|nr:hypothetical protein [Halobacteriovoraceae bacterium]
MSKKDYLNKQGHLVFTSEYHLSRGSCCKSSCLHCPYGHALKKENLTLEELNSSNLDDAKIIYDKYFLRSKITENLLSSAFGSNDSKSEFDNDTFKVLLLKNTVCGIVEIENKSVKALYLADYFEQQGIDEAIVMTLFTT